MKSQIVNTLISFLLFIPVIGNSQVLVNATELGILPKAFVTFSGITVADYNVKYYKVTYNTIDLDGLPTVASGLIAVPMNPLCDSLPIALYAHGSVLLKTDVPSSSNSESDLGKAIASRGMVVAMPDYLGLGDSPGFHPYSHWETEATSSIDILRAAKEFVQDSMAFSYSNEMFLTGYSQGGHASMATAKYILDNQLQNEFNIAGLAPMSGPYNFSKRQTDLIIYDEPFSYPGYIVYLIMSYENIYGGIYNVDSDYLQTPYDTTIPPLFDGNTAMVDVHPQLPTKVSEYLNPIFLNDFLADTTNKVTPFWQAILDNDNYDWTPTFPVNLLYCSGDDLVNPLNTQDAYDAMQANGASNITKKDLGNLDHLGCVIPAVSEMIEYFQELRTDCKTATGITKLETRFDLDVYPNPANQSLRINITNIGNGNFELYNMSGQIVKEGVLNADGVITTNNLVSGVYLLKFTTASSMYLEKVTIIH